MKSKFFYIAAFLSLFLFVNCSDKKKTPESTNKETLTATKDTIPDKDSLEELNKEINAIPHHYICYKNDDKSSMQLSIAFDSEGNAKFVRYKGQKDSILLQNIKEDYQDGGAYPTITQFYNEMYQGKKNGTYELTHAGIWDYAKYTREKDGEVFQFTINHDMTVIGDNYRTTPCFE